MILRPHTLVILAVLSALSLLAATACATLPDTEALIAHHTGQAAGFENASGPGGAISPAAPGGRVGYGLPVAALAVAPVVTYSALCAPSQSGAFFVCLQAQK
jgi:hypothetical protein